MKILITADIHFGYQGKLDDITWSFNNMINYCVENNIKYMFILGDLVHDRFSLTHDVSNRIHDLFEEANKQGLNIVAFPGNHDMFNRNNWEINSLKPFQRHIHLIDDVSWFELYNQKFFVIPFIESEKLYMKVLNKVNEMASDNDILLTHVGVNGAIYNACFLCSNWSHVTFNGSKFKKVYAGHFHNYQNIEKLYYPGSPIPFRFDEGLVQHGFIVYDTEKSDHEFINIYDVKSDSKAPPDYVTICSEDIESSTELIKNNMVRVQINENDDKESIRKRLAELGAEKITMVKEKEKKIELDKLGKGLKSDQIFEDWVNYDNPEGLDRDLLIRLEKSVRSDTVIKESDD